VVKVLVAAPAGAPVVVTVIIQKQSAMVVVISSNSSGGGGSSHTIKDIILSALRVEHTVKFKFGPRGAIPVTHTPQTL